MVIRRWTAPFAGFAFGVIIAACASAEFPYRDYGVIPSQDKLLGPEPKDDLSLIGACEPDPDPSPGGPKPVKGKCHVILSAEYLRLKQDYIELRKRLEACESAL